MPTRPRQHGFTIVELLVTMTILGLMLFLVNQLFNDTSVAVTTSVQVSKTIATSRSINEQLTNDADAMLGPGDPATDSPGYIVIIQQKLPSTNAKLFDPQTLNEVTVTELRTDQLVFIRDAEGLKSMTPDTASRYGTSLIGMPGDRAKVWYGHAQRTDPDGQPRTGTNSTLGGTAAGPDRIGSDFILGRQALLFNPTDMSLAIPAKVSANASNYTHAANFYYGAAVSNTGYGTGAATYLGLTDVTDDAYGPTSDTSSLLYQVTDTSVLTVANHTTNYLNTAYPVAANRLHVNPAPDADDTDYATWAIAQGHPILAQNCSEIIVDFAADLNGNGRIDRSFGGTPTDDSGAIYWYDTLQQNPTIATNLFAWANPGNLTQPLVTNTANQNIFVFRVDDDQEYTATGSPVSSWPYMIRIRYRLHDTRGRLTSNHADALRDGLDNDGDGAADGSDPLADEDQISGRWFERVISVPRP